MSQAGQMQSRDLDFFASHALLDCAAVQFQRIIGHGFRETLEGAALIAKAWKKNISLCLCRSPSADG